MTDNVEKETKAQMLGYANIFTAGINPSRVETLSNTEKDLDNQDYLRIEEQLSKMYKASSNSHIRWIYTMFQKDNNIVFGPDSIPKGEYGHSEPGAIYADPSEKMKQAIFDLLENGNSEILGPDTDQWGTWLSVLVPIKNFETGKILGILGMDIEYSNYRTLIFRQQLLPIVSTVLALILFFSISFYILRIKKITKKLKESADSLKENQERYKDLYNKSIRNSQKIEEDMDKMRILSAELEKTNNLMIGRELKMIELKKELTKLKNK